MLLLPTCWCVCAWVRRCGCGCGCAPTVVASLALELQFNQNIAYITVCPLHHCAVVVWLVLCVLCTIVPSYIFCLQYASLLGIHHGGTQQQRWRVGVHRGG